MKSFAKTFIILLIMPMILSSCINSYSERSKDVALSWIPEESYFVDYEINGEKIKFRYSICFHNHTSEPTEIGICAKFNKRELNGWLRYEGFFIGDDNDGLLKYGLIKPKEKTNIVYTFEGDYLGGTVNENLSFPEELMTIEK